MKARTRFWHDDEHGSGSMIMISVIVVVMMLASAATIIAGYLVAGHRAKAAADLSAISGASAVLSGNEGCATARRIAGRQRASATCTQVGDAIEFVITVTAAVEVPVTFPGLPSLIEATAHAGPSLSGN
jgi:secretion/DNA translocation related TadE-like protein